MKKIPKSVALFMLPLLTEGGGAEKYFISLARGINKSFSRVDIVTLNEKDFRKLARLFYLTHLDFKKVNISGREGEETIKTLLGKSNWIKASFRSLGHILGRYDLIYAKNEIIDLFFLKMFGLSRLPPVIVGVHTPVFYPQVISIRSTIHNLLYSGIVYKWLLKNIRVVHTSNKEAQRYLSRMKITNIFTIPYPFSVRAVQIAQKKYKVPLQMNKEDFKICFAGRLSEQKGVDKLNPLCNYLSKLSDRRVKLTIFGTGDNENTKLVRKLSDTYRFVTYHGHIKNSHIPDVLAQHDLLIVPSRWETMPFIILEAQSLGIPVLAYDIPGPSDIIEDKKTGYLAQNDDEFKELLKGFINNKNVFDPKYIVSMVKKRFNDKSIYAKIVRLFEDTIYEKT